MKLTKAQIRSMIGRWRPSRENPMTIGELVEDIIKKVKEHQTEGIFTDIAEATVLQEKMRKFMNW